MGYYGGRGARLVEELGPVRGQGPARPDARPQATATSAAGSRRPRLTIPGDWPSGVYLGRLTTIPGPRYRALLAELRRLHRPRRSPRRHPVPVLRQHLAGLQPLAEQLFALHPSQGQPGPLGRRQLRPALRPRGAARRRRQRPAHRRLGRVPAARVPAGLLARAARLRRHLLLQQRHAHARPRPAGARHSSASATTNTGTSGSSRASSGCATRA